MEKHEIPDVVNKAFELARAATDKMLTENPNVWYPCGFAWVLIRPSRGPVVKYLKDNDLGHSAYGGGFQVYNPSRNPTQWMDAKIAGARAFANHLIAHGIKCTVESRLD